MKTNVHESSLLKSTKQTVVSSENGGINIAVAVLTIIPGFGLLVSLIVFICFEHQVLQKKVSTIINWFYITIKIYKDFGMLLFKSPENHVILIEIQPEVCTNDS